MLSILLGEYPYLNSSLDAPCLVSVGNDNLHQSSGSVMLSLWMRVSINDF